MTMTMRSCLARLSRDWDLIVDKRMILYYWWSLDKENPWKPDPLLSNEYSIDRPILSFSFSAIIIDNVTATFKKIKTSDGSGSDGIASNFLKKALLSLMDLCVTGVSVGRINLYISFIAIVPKKHSAKLFIIFHLSYPKSGDSINSFIKNDNFSLMTYVTIDHVIKQIKLLGPASVHSPLPSPSWELGTVSDCSDRASSLRTKLSYLVSGVLLFALTNCPTPWNGYCLTNMVLAVPIGSFTIYWMVPPGRQSFLCLGLGDWFHKNIWKLKSKKYLLWKKGNSRRMKNREQV